MKLSSKSIDRQFTKDGFFSLSGEEPYCDSRTRTWKILKSPYYNILECPHESDEFYKIELFLIRIEIRSFENR